MNNDEKIRSDDTMYTNVAVTSADGNIPNDYNLWKNDRISRAEWYAAFKWNKTKVLKILTLRPILENFLILKTHNSF